MSDTLEAHIARQRDEIVRGKRILVDALQGLNCEDWERLRLGDLDDERIDEIVRERVEDGE